MWETVGGSKLPPRIAIFFNVLVLENEAALFIADKYFCGGIDFYVYTILDF